MSLSSLKDNKETATEQEKQTKTPAEAANYTPMMQQYHSIKEQYKDYLLLYRMGDFFELFYDDAIVASKALDIVLTKRGKSDGDDIPMCGVPHHAFDSYSAKLIKMGYKLAVCEQTESPEQAKEKRGYKAVVNREVVRIITPGTITEDNLLESKKASFLMAVQKADKVGTNLCIAWADISTGEFYYSNTSSRNLYNEILKISPSEIIVNDDIFEVKECRFLLDEMRKILTVQSSVFFNKNKSKEKIKQYYEIKSDLADKDISDSEAAVCAALLEYISITQIGQKPAMNFPKNSDSKNYMELDASAINNLEIFYGADGSRQNSVFNAIDETITPQGARLLQKYLARPEIIKTEIEQRQEVVEYFYKHKIITGTVREELKGVADFQRILSRLSVRRGTPREMGLLKTSLKNMRNILALLANNEENLPKKLLEVLKNNNGFDKIISILDEALTEEPANNVNDGGFIREGFDAKLDQFRNLRFNAEELKNNLAKKYAEESGISTLKIKENNVVGLFIEITNVNIDKVPESFIHRQTLVNGIRYTTKELKEIENNLINAKSYALNLELEIFENLRQSILENSELIQEISFSGAFVDLMSAWAILAEKKNYIKPEILENSLTEIRDGKHIIVENSMQGKSKEKFIANDLKMNDGDKIWLITGPNMSGKSTFLRQNAIIIIMAQMGCFVPAASAKINITDKIFCRVGASDNLAKGHSTFMVEMAETANILHNATKNSFVILDEIGRGTATYDGLAIAWAVLEHLHDKNKCNTLFATHYHELTELAGKMSRLSLHTVEIKEWEDEIIFLHKVVEGVAGKSYGIYAAKLAGIPKDVLARAKQIHSILIEQNKGNSNQIISDEMPLFSMRDFSTKDFAEAETKVEVKAEAKDLPVGNNNEVLEKIRDFDVNSASPIDALNFLNNIKKEIKN